MSEESGQRERATEHEPTTEQVNCAGGSLVDRGPHVQVQGYEIVRELSRGGQGVVYQAVQESTKRKVAIKVLLDGAHASKSARRRFEREVELVSHLKHPNIIAVFDSGVTQDGQPFYVMDYVRGEPVTQYARRKRLPLEQTLGLFATICDAVNYAHQRGVIHRDLKPSNVLVDDNGNLYILDFGLAKPVTERSETLTTVTGQVMGTMPYLSPEQTRGNPDAIDIRTDVYALGVILYELLTGHYPYPVAGALVDVMKHITETPPSPPTRLWTKESGVGSRSMRAMRPGRCPIDSDVETIALKALAKDRERRYQSAGEFSRDIRHYLSGEPIEAKRDSALYLLRMAIRRHRTAMAVLALLVLMLGVIAVVLAISREHAIASEVLANRRRDEAIEARRAEQAARRAAEMMVVDMHVASGLLADERGEMGLASLWFAQAAKLSSGDAGREQINRLRTRMWQRQATIPVRALPHEENSTIVNMEFHPSGRYLMTRTLEGKWRIWDWQAERVVPVAGAESAVCLAWSPDGGRLAVAPRTGSVRLYRFPEGNVERELDFAGVAQAMAFSRDGMRLALGGAGARVWDCRAGAWSTGELPHPATVWAVVFNPQGDRLVTATEDGKARVFAVPGGASGPRPLFEPVPHLKRNANETGLKPILPTFIDAGRGLLTHNPGLTVLWRDARTGEVVRKVESSSSNGWINCIAASRDGRRFVLGGFRVAEMWDVSKGACVAQWTHGNTVHSLAFSPDEREAVSACWDNLVRIWSVSRDQLAEKPLFHQTSAGLATFSPDGRLLATAQSGGLVRVWARPQHGARDYEVVLPGSGTLIRLSPDGRYFVPGGSTHRSQRMNATRVYEVSSGEAAGPPLASSGVLTDAAFSPDGRQVAVAGSGEELRLWDWRLGKEQVPPVRMPGKQYRVSYSPDGRLLAILCKGGEILLIDPADGRVVRQMLQDSGPLTENFFTQNGAVLFSADGRSLLSWGGDRKLRVWDPAAGTLRYPPLVMGHMCHDVSFSPDGRLMATASYDNTARVYEVESGKLMGPVLGHPDWVFRARFSPDGRHLLTACRDQMARLWDWQKGGAPLAAVRHSDEVYDAAFLDEGRCIVTTGRDDTVRVWDATSGKPVAPAWQLSGPGACLAVAAQQQLVLVSGNSSRVQAFDVAGLRTAEAGTVDDTVLCCELISARQIRDGTLLNLTSAEWLDRWQRLRARHPEYPDLTGLQK